MSGNESGTPVPSDADLIVAARGGDEAAYAELYSRHVGGARAAARSLIRSRSDADDLVSEAFTRVLRALRNGGGPELAFRPYLLTAVRNAFYDRTRKDQRVDVREEVPEDLDAVLLSRAAMAGEDKEMIARAFANLPERWQTVLWHTEVEGRSPAEVAPMLGIAPNAVAALAYRAREGLREAYLQAHLQLEPPAACADTRNKLGGYARDTLSARDRGKVEQHLDGCDKCRAVLVELRDVSSTLRVALPPVLLGVPATVYLHHLAAGGKGVLAFLGARPRGQQAAIGGGVVAAGVALAVAVAALTGDPKPAQVAAVSITAATTTVAATTSAPTSVAITVRATSTSAATTTTSSSTTTTSSTTVPAPVVPTFTVATTARRATTTTRAVTTTRAATTTTSTTIAPTTTTTEPPPRRAALTVSGSPVGPVVSGRSAYFSVVLANAGPDAAPNALVTMTFPAGLSYVGVQGDGWTCASGAAVTCARATLAPGAASTVLLETAVAPGATGTPSVSVRATSDALGAPTGGTADVSLGTVQAAGPSPLYAGLRHGDIVTIGNTLMTCDPADQRCAAAQADDPMVSGGSVPLDNSAYTMAPVDTDLLAETTASSSAVLTLPPGATVNRAWLVWGGTAANGGMVRASYAGVRLTGPAGPPQTLAKDPTSTGGACTPTCPDVYARLDVTPQVQVSGTYTFGSVGGFADQAGDNKNRSGGWALIVQYDRASDPMRSLVVLDGMVVISNNTREVALGLLGPGAPPEGVKARIGFVAWDGDRGVDRTDHVSLKSGATPTVIDFADASNPLDDIFNSTVCIAGLPSAGGLPAYPNTLGFDADAFDVTVHGGGAMTLGISSTGDAINLGVITLSVPS